MQWLAVSLLPISIHAPRVGSDARMAYQRGFARGFQSTLPVWGATTRKRARKRMDKHFNPRSPCGERPIPRESPCTAFRFQSTLPVWGATIPSLADGVAIADFNPRSPCGERRILGANARWNLKFQSTLPVWGATRAILAAYVRDGVFQSTLPVWGATPALRCR